MTSSRRFAADAGIAIGPILFVIALLGILGTVMATSSGGFGSASVADRVTADIVNQANLIRTKINECNLRCLNAQGLEPTGGALTCPNETWPDNDVSGANPASGTAIAVSAMRCPATLNASSEYTNLWLMTPPTQLPPPTAGFPAWQYINAGDAGGRCIWTAPTGGNASAGAVEGLTRAAAKFSSSEVDYDAASSSQKFVLIITPATGTLNTNCEAP